MIGPILQELLSGLKSRDDFEDLRASLSSVVILDLSREVFIAAARIANACRRKGFAAGPIDYMIASACVEYGYPLLTADRHFLRIARYCDLRLLPPLARTDGAGRTS